MTIRDEAILRADRQDNDCAPHPRAVYCEWNTGVKCPDCGRKWTRAELIELPYELLPGQPRTLTMMDAMIRKCRAEVDETAWKREYYGTWQVAATQRSFPLILAGTPLWKSLRDKGF